MHALGGEEGKSCAPPRFRVPVPGRSLTYRAFGHRVPWVMAVHAVH